MVFIFLNILILKQNKTKNKEKNDKKFIFSEFNLLVNAENVIEVN
jgi:hypothetical protein